MELQEQVEKMELQVLMESKVNRVKLELQEQVELMELQVKMELQEQVELMELMELTVETLMLQEQNLDQRRI